MKDYDVSREDLIIELKKEVDAGVSLIIKQAKKPPPLDGKQP